VEPLIEHDIFSLVKGPIQYFSTDRISRNKPILLVSKPDLEGSLSLAPIESALLDAGIPYRRRFSNSEPDYSPFIQISDHMETPKKDPAGLSLSTIIVDGLRGRLGDLRKGPLSVVAQAHVLASALNNKSHRLRRMRPWLLSGNWINEALDTTYDPVYSSLRDYLSSEGSIRVVPVPEVEHINFSNFPWIERIELEEASRIWGNSELEKREEIMGSLVSPILKSRLPSTARSEELLWHCVLGPGWETDLASQISAAKSLWENNTPTRAASIVADSLISQGEISLFYPENATASGALDS
jgi:hypothetical protein|tara:strand:+ start:1735 stop:2628 length:894 start_codon:yes stop_codon:yes gene_type:complete